LTPGSVKRVRVRLLPWRPRWRTRKGRWDDLDLDVPDLGDDPVSLVIGLLFAFVALPALILLLVGVLLLSAEIAVVLALLPFALVGQLAGLVPWYLRVTTTDGEKQWIETGGTREMLSARRYYRSLRA
jgi:hypothetical protein